MSRVGRPQKPDDIRRDQEYRIRFNKNELDTLDQLSSHTGLDKSKLIRLCLYLGCALDENSVNDIPPFNRNDCHWLRMDFINALYGPQKIVDWEGRL